VIAQSPRGPGYIRAAQDPDNWLDPPVPAMDQPNRPRFSMADRQPFPMDGLTR